MMQIRSGRGQSFVEYTILFTVILAALVGMQVFAKRGLQVGLKNFADEIGSQRDGIRFEARDRRETVIAKEGLILVRDAASSNESGQTMTTTTATGGSFTTALTETASVAGTLTSVGPDVADHSTIVMREAQPDIPFFAPPPPPPVTPPINSGSGSPSDGSLPSLPSTSIGDGSDPGDGSTAGSPDGVSGAVAAGAEAAGVAAGIE